MRHPGDNYPSGNARATLKVISGLIALFLVSGCVQAQAERIRLRLNEGWLVRQVSEKGLDVSTLGEELERPDRAWMPARMPMQVPELLFQQGLIADPRVSENAAKASWIVGKDWVYVCRFPTPQGLKGRAFLRFDGLDTLARAYLNGQEIGRFQNMFRHYAVEVTGKLASKGSQNLLAIHFQAPLPYIDNYRVPTEQQGLFDKHKFLRKSHSDFSSYLGARPHFMKVGVFRDVWLDMPREGWLEDVWVRTELAPDHSRAAVNVSVEVAGQGRSLDWRLRDAGGTLVAEGARAVEPEARISIPVSRPRLWWPRTHGQPYLYQLQVTLRDGARVLDERTMDVGIRAVRLITRDEKSGQPRFAFAVNGQLIYLMGACWAPPDLFTHTFDNQRARALLDLMEHARMNAVRVWGEGHEPPGEFYQQCDRRGILVWQDFFFGNGMHPSGVPQFDVECLLEVEGLIKRLRNHPSLLLWVGGNENHMGADFAGKSFQSGRQLFHEIMPRAVAKLDPDRAFHPSSPFGGPAPNWPLEGDWHDYTTVTFSPEASVPLFTSESLRASPPTLASMKKFLSEEELWPQGWQAMVRTPGTPAWPPAWTYHSTGLGTWDRIGRIERLVDADGPGQLVRNLGTAHGEYLRERVERQRRGVPDGEEPKERRHWGNLIWRLNDPWPMIYSSVVDYYLDPKIPYYYLRRAHDPVLVSFEQTADWIAAWVVNDSPQSVSGRLTVRRRRFDGRLIKEAAIDVVVPAAQAQRCIKLTSFGPVSLREEYLEAEFSGRKVTHLLAPERYLRLPPAKIQVSVTGDSIEVETDRYAREVALELAGAAGAVFEDNYFDLTPGERRRLRIVHRGGGNVLKVSAVNAGALTVD